MNEKREIKKTLTMFLKSTKFKLIILISFAVLVVVLNFSLLAGQIISPESYFININDADRIDNETTAIRISELQTAMRANKGKFDRWKAVSGIIEVDTKGKILWSYLPDGLEHHVDHEIVLKDDGYFFCDSFGDSIKYVRKETKEVEWTYHLGDLNWTEVNPEWGADHYYNLPCEQWNLEECIDWSHINDIDFKDYGSWEAMLVSIRNFNLIIEINYTSAKLKEIAVADDVVWYYRGEMYHQHNPDYLPNGNILIVDSDKQTIIEVNRTTKEIVWEWTHETITWPRDCDLITNNRLLITDIDKALVVNRTSGEILKAFSQFFGGYEADYIESSNTVLISCGSSGLLYEFDIDTGEKVWKWGTNVITAIAFSNLILFLIFEFCWILALIFSENKWLLLIIIPIVALIGFELSILIDFNDILVTIFLRSING